MPDLATSIVDGYGIAFNPAYVSIVQGNYTKLADAALPESDYIGPLYVVSQFSASDGVGGTYTNSFWYTGARLHRQGRGFEGFATKRTLDSRNGLYSYEDYQRAFPYTGMLASSALYQPNNATLMQRVTRSFATTTLATTANQQRYFPFVNQSVQYRYEAGGVANGALTAQATTSYVYDSYGNATQVTTATIDKDTSSPSYTQTWSETLARTITNDTVNWCLGQPTQITQQETLPDGTSQTRTVASTVDYASCRVTQEVIEPASSTLKVTTNYGFDSCGNVNSVQVIGKKPDGTDMPARTTTASYGTRCQFVESVTNALSQTTQLSWDYHLAVQTGETDPNGLATSWQYDRFRRKTRENRPDGTATTWSYNDCTSLGCVNANNKMIVIATQLDSGGSFVTDQWLYADRLDRAIASSTRLLSGAYNRLDREYDALGRVNRETAPCWWASCTQYWTTFSYDLLDRVSQVSRPISDSDPTLQTTTAYYEGLTTRVLDPLAKQATRIDNVLGQLARSTDHNGYYQSFDYDGFGSLLRVMDSAGNVLRSNAYNLRGMRTGQTDIDLGSNWIYTSNSLGEVVSQLDAKSQTTTFAYDPLGRLTSRTEPEGTSTFTFGSSATYTAGNRNIGRLIAMSGPGYSESLSYDNISRMAQRAITSDAPYIIDYAYNSIGTINTLTYPTSTSS
ncbi:MAG: toxin TcdB middle/N-terminal domain-containing protein, partial [Steroidobacteraceae bacterium]